MPVIGSRAIAGVRSFGLYVLAALSSVIDTFNRANNATDLGNINGQKWKIWRGAWAIVTNKASSSSTGSTNALATLKFTKTDVTVSVSGQDPGMGASFWVTDANNWYASVYTQTQVCQTCSVCNGTWNAQVCNANCCNGFFPTWSPYCTTWNAANCGSFNAAGCNAYACNVYNSANTGNRAIPYGFCFSPNRFCTSPVPTTCAWFNAYNCALNATGNCTASGIFCCQPWATYLVPSSCNQWGTVACNCTNEYRVNILNSIAGTVSTVSANLFSAAVASFKTALSGSTATITAYSAVNYVTQIGSPVATSISPAPVKSTSHGIIKTSSPFQGTSIDDFGVS